MNAEELMRLAIEEARKGGRKTRPNPQVGAALVSKKNELVLGYHHQAGGPHAEREVLAEAQRRGLDVRGARMAVTLEPCAHHGKTPPCADALVAAGIAKVFVAGLDPNPLVSGQGLKKLRAAGIEVEENVLRAEAEALNREWLTAHRQGRAFVRLKMATSLDGLFTAADGRSQWITSSAARRRGHLLRAEADAVLTSAATVAADNPRLSARDEKGEELPDQPKIFVLSRRDKMDLRKTALEGRAEACLTPDLGKFLEALHGEGLHQVLVEAGPKLSSAFLEAGLVNEVALFLGPRFLGGAGQRLSALRGGALPGLESQVSSVERLDEGDILLFISPLNP